MALLTPLLTILLAETAEALTGRRWISPHALEIRLDRRDVGSVNRTFLADGDLDGRILPGQVVSVASLSGLRAVAPTLSAGTPVMYDIEKSTDWRWTPDAEKAHPYRSMRWFVTRAREAGFIAVLAPGAAYRDRAALLDADAFVAQVQAIMDPVMYRRKVCRIVREFHGPVYAEVTANGRPGHDVRGLIRQWRAGRVCTSRFAVWGRTDPANVEIAKEFLSRVDPEP